jgi:hypothetical protein
MRKPKLTRVEKLLRAVRREPSKTCNDPRQLTLEDAIKQRALYKLDRVIEDTLAREAS